MTDIAMIRVLQDCLRQRQKIINMPTPIFSSKLQRINFYTLIVVLITMGFNYFEIYYHYWFLKLTGGYIIKIWLLPVATFCLVLAGKFYSKDFRIRLDEIAVMNAFVAVYFVIGVVSLLMHEDLFYAGKYGLIMFAPLTIYMSIANVFRDNGKIEKALKILFIGGVIFSMADISMYHLVSLGLWSNDYIKVHYMFTDVADTVRVEQYYIPQGFGYGNLATRVTLPCIEPVFFGATLAPLVLVGLYLAMKSDTRLHKLLYYGLSSVVYYALMNTLSKSVFIAFWAGAILFLWYVRKRMIDVIIILLLLGTITLINKPMIYRMIQLAGSVVETYVIQEPPAKTAEEPKLAAPPAKTAEEPKLAAPPAKTAEEPKLAAPPAKTAEEPKLAAPPAKTAEEPKLAAPPAKTAEEPKLAAPPAKTAEEPKLAAPPAKTAEEPKLAAPPAKTAEEPKLAAPPAKTAETSIKEEIEKKVIAYSNEVKGKIYFQKEGHIDSISESLKSFSNAPFFGNGITYIEKEHHNNRWYAEHNRYLYILTTAGLLTLIPYVAFLFGLIISVRKFLVKKIKTSGAIPQIGAVCLPIIVICVIQINNSGMERYYYWILFGLAAAWVRNSAYEEKNENPVN